MEFPPCGCLYLLWTRMGWGWSGMWALGFAGIREIRILLAQTRLPFDLSFALLFQLLWEKIYFTTKVKWNVSDRWIGPGVHASQFLKPQILNCLIRSLTWWLVSKLICVSLFCGQARRNSKACTSHLTIGSFQKKIFHFNLLISFTSQARRARQLIAL